MTNEWERSVGKVWETDGEIFEVFETQQASAKSIGKTFETIFDTAVPNIAADPDTHTTEKIGVGGKLDRQLIAILAAQIAGDRLLHFRTEFGGTLDTSVMTFRLKTHKAQVDIDHTEIAARLFIDQLLDHLAHDVHVELALSHGGLEQLATDSLGVFAGFHG